MYIVNPSSEAVVEMSPNAAHFDLEVLFRSQYGRVARIIARVVRDPARAEDLAVEVFLKLWRNPKAQGEGGRLALSRRPSDRLG
jgi:DNA-directed RNA polymerase specialized sigma24 family protein